MSEERKATKHKCPTCGDYKSASSTQCYKCYTTKGGRHQEIYKADKAIAKATALIMRGQQRAGITGTHRSQGGTGQGVEMNTSEPFVVDPAKKPFYDLLQKAEAWVDEQGFNHNCDARLAAFALSLLQWKDVADGLPEVAGMYLFKRKGEPSSEAEQYWYDPECLDAKKDRIREDYEALFGPIPEYVKEQR